MSEEKKTKKETAPAPNIQWTGKRARLNKLTGKKEMVPRPASKFWIDGPDKIKLPEGIADGVLMEPELAARLKELSGDFKTPKARVEKPKKPRPPRVKKPKSEVTK